MERLGKPLRTFSLFSFFQVSSATAFQLYYALSHVPLGVNEAARTFDTDCGKVVHGRSILFPKTSAEFFFKLTGHTVSS